jgi:LysM repeat protein
MNSHASTETDSLPGLSSQLIRLGPVEPPAKICPCLGLQDDPETRFSFPAQRNACHRAATPSPLTLAHQASYCLSAEYRHCPVFRYNAHLAAGPRRPGVAMLRRQLPLAAVLLLSTAILLGLLGFGWQRLPRQVASGSPPNATSVTLPAATVILVAVDTAPPSPSPTAPLTPAAAATATATAGAPLAGLAKLIVPPPVSAAGSTLASPTPVSPTPSPTLLPTLEPAPSPTPAPLCRPRSDWPVYLVRPGDTLFSLAQARGTTVSFLMNANCLTTARIMAGQLLYLPPLPATAVPPPPTTTPQPATATPLPPATELPPPNPTATPSIPSPATNTPAPPPTLLPPPSDTPPPTATPAPPPTHTPAPPPADRPPAP